MIRKLVTWYAASWLFLLWSALMLCVGASMMFVGTVSALEANGIHVTQSLLAMVSAR